jgi:hypothetical protein
LNGTVNPSGSDTAYYFQWGLTSAYGSVGRARFAGHGTRTVDVRTRASGLISGTVYHFRLVATNRFGTSTGDDRTFRTAGHPPAGVSTGPATQLTTTGATVTGTVNPNGEATTWVFQYGTTTAYNLMTYAGTVAASSPSATVAYALTGLTPGTTFHYRLVDFHKTSGPSYGLDATFMTLPSPRPVPQVHALTTPHRARHRPFVFTTYGTVSGPSSFSPAQDCNGNATIRYLLRRRVVALIVTAVQPNCTFSAQMRFAHKPGRHRRRKLTLRVLITFDGNGYLAPVRARPEKVVLG